MLFGEYDGCLGQFVLVGDSLAEAMPVVGIIYSFAKE